MGLKVLGALAVAIGSSLAVAALLGFLVTPWVTIGTSVFCIALLTLHRRRPARIRKGDFVLRVHHRAPSGDD